MDRPAKQCSSPSCNFNDLFINCEGICRQRFHAFCVGLSTADVPMISASPYFFWFCDTCREHIRTGRTTIAVRSVAGPSEGEKACWSTRCIFTDQLVRCDGPCGKDFHGICVKLSKADLSVMGSSANIVWFCSACKSDVLPVLAGSGGESTEEVEQRDTEEVATEVLDRPESSPVSEDNGKELEPDVELFKVNDDPSTKNVEQDLPITKEGNSIADDSQMKDLQKVSTTGNEIPDIPAAVESPAVDTSNNQRSPDSSSNLVGNSNPKDPSTTEKIPDPDVRTSSPTVFTFGEMNQPDPSDNTPDIAEKFKEIRKTIAEQNKRLTSLKLKLETDESSNVPATKKLLLGTGSSVNTAVPATKSKFSLFLRFSEPNMSDGEAEQVVRHALGMSRRDPVTAWSVTPLHIAFPRFSTFRVDVDARWKSRALCSSTWCTASDLLEHREWFDYKIR